MSQLRDKENGCEWDKEQTFKSIAPFTIEEAYEVADSIERNDYKDLKEELGDLLLQVVFLSQIAKEDDLFSFDDVASTITQKLIRRHPYVFSKKRHHSSEEQTEQWEQIKESERGSRNQSGILDGIAKSLPSLKRSQQIQKRASRVGFDWPTVSKVLKKIEEETKELVEAKEFESQERINEEFGDLMFSIVNLGRHLKVDPEEALKKTNTKFITRFKFIEDEIKSQGRNLEDTSLEEMEQLWQSAKNTDSSNRTSN